MRQHTAGDSERTAWAEQAKYALIENPWLTSSQEINPNSRAVEFDIAGKDVNASPRAAAALGGIRK
jgi:hypothetical protein